MESEIKEITNNQFEVENIISSGKYATVIKDICDGQQVALKILSTSIVKHEILQEFKKEVTSIQHENIIRYFNIFIEQDRCSLIMEFISKGSLNKILFDSKIELPWNPLRLNISLDIVRGLNYLHSINILHGNLKSNNVLISNDWKAKLCDFGEYKFRIQGGNSSVRWKAPELFKNGEITKNSDIYSLGTTLWEISTRKYPYVDMEEGTIMSKIEYGFQLKIPIECPTFLFEIIQECWNLYPKKRPDISSLISTMEEYIIGGKMHEDSSTPGLIEYEKGLNLTDGMSSMYYFERSAEFGYPPAFIRCSNIMLPKKNRKVWRDKAANSFEYYRLKAESGDAEDLFNIGRCYYDGLGVPVNFERAMFYFEKAGELGSPRALNNLAVCYQYGRGTYVDFKKAAELYQKAIEHNSDIALNNLAVCYEVGEGVEIDREKAVSLYLKAAETGQSLPFFNLGIFYDEGPCMDGEKSLYYYTIAAEKGISDAQYALGCLYQKGRFVKRDPVKAVKWFTEAAEQESIAALHSLALCYQDGDGVFQDPVTAFEYFEKAANQGYTESQYNLGLCYQFGIGVPVDINAAFEWYIKAHYQGHEGARNCLGLCFRFGNGVHVNHAQAVSFFEMASVGSEDAIYNLGLCYLFGDGVDIDFIKAKEYFCNAASKGNARAKLRISTLENSENQSLQL